MDTTPDLIGAWVHGWAASRGVSMPMSVPGGWRVPVGLRGHRVRYVMTTRDTGSLAELSLLHPRPGTWMKTAGSPAVLREALSLPWVMAETGYLMTSPFYAHETGMPPGYEARIKTEGDVLTVSFIDNAGATASAGRLAPAGHLGVIDQVVTTPAHRRRGLGRAVMSLLAHHGQQRGLRGGVLVATPEGRALYLSLGWRVCTSIAAAHVPETEHPDVR